MQLPSEDRCLGFGLKKSSLIGVGSHDAASSEQDNQSFHKEISKKKTLLFFNFPKVSEAFIKLEMCRPLYERKSPRNNPFFVQDGTWGQG